MSNKTPLETLKEARAKIEKPEFWTQFKFAKDGNGLRVHPTSDAATCWCAIGAIEAVSPHNFSAAWSALECAVDGDIATFNDSHTHSQVLKAFDAAIELAARSA